MPNLPIPTRLTSLQKLIVIPFVAFFPILGIYFGYYLGRQTVSTTANKFNPTPFLSPSLIPTSPFVDVFPTSTAPIPRVVVKQNLPEGWSTTALADNLYSLGYDPDQFRAICPEFKGRNCKITSKAFPSINIYVFSDTYSGGSRRLELENRFGKTHDPFVEYQLGQYFGVGTVFRNPLEAGGNQFILAVPVASKIIFFKANLFNDEDGTGFDLDYLKSKVLPAFNITPSLTFNKKAPDSSYPAAGICAGPGPDTIIRTQVGPDYVSIPRCQIVKSAQKLSLTNLSDKIIHFSLGSQISDINPGDTFVTTQPFGDYLLPGVHFSGGPEIWLQE